MSKMKEKEKKPFKETKFGKFLQKAGQVVPDVLGIGLQAIQGDISGAIQSTKEALEKKAKNNTIAKELLTELTIKEKEIELEFRKVEVEESKAIMVDIQDARSNRKESDWMFNFVTIFGLVLCAFVVYAITFINIPTENKDLFIHLVGIVEGAIFLKIFTFFFGSSKGSRDKNKFLK